MPEAEHSPIPFFLRWAGGKRWLIPVLNDLFGDHKFKNYVEPFLGGGSLFLGWGHQMADKFSLSDKERTLIETYAAVGENPDLVLSTLNQWPTNKKNYLALRKQEVNGNKFLNAARFIYLNRLCWNGLFRVNQQGKFNVPYGKKKIPGDLDLQIRLASSRLNIKNITLKVQDYAISVKAAKKGDILIVDPPYVEKKLGTPPHRCYNAEQFLWSDQLKLASECIAAADRGAVVVVTPGRSAHNLYPKSKFKKIMIFRNQIIAASADYRQKYRENLLVSINWSRHVKG